MKVGSPWTVNQSTTMPHTDGTQLGFEPELSHCEGEDSLGLHGDVSGLKLGNMFSEGF